MNYRSLPAASAILLAVFCIVLLSGGCWSRREIETLGFVLASGVDTCPESEDVEVTALIAKPFTLLQDQPGSDERPYWMETSCGSTVFEAVRAILPESPRRLFWAHNDWVLMGEERARRGLVPVLDFYVREAETRRESRLVIAKNTRASEILKTEYALEQLMPVAAEKSLLVSRRALGSVLDTKIHDFLIALEEPGVEPVAIRVDISSEGDPEQVGEKLHREEVLSTPRLSGAAVFRGDRLVGWLDRPATRGLNWIRGEVESTSLQVKHPESDRPMSLEVTSASSTVRVEVKEDTPRATVRVAAEGRIVEATDFVDPFSRADLWSSLKRRAAQVIRNDIDMVLNAAQDDFKSDIFGFGTRIYREDNQKWQDLREGWNDTFARMNVQVLVSVQLSQTGSTFRSSRPGG